MRRTKYDYSKLPDEADTQKITVCFRTPSKKGRRRGTWICQRVKYSPDYDTDDGYIALSVARCAKGRDKGYSPHAQVAVVPPGNQQVEIYNTSRQWFGVDQFVSRRQWAKAPKRFVGGKRHRWINEICDAYSESREARPRRGRDRDPSTGYRRQRRRR